MASASNRRPIGRPRGPSTTALIAVGFVVGAISLFAAVRWFTIDRSELQDLLGQDITAGVSDRQLEDAQMTREEFEDFLVGTLRVAFGGIMLAVGAICTILSFLLLRSKSAARIGFLIMGVLGVFGSGLLLVVANGSGVLAGWLSSVAFIILPMLPSTRRDLAPDPVQPGANPPFPPGGFSPQHPAQPQPGRAPWQTGGAAAPGSSPYWPATPPLAGGLPPPPVTAGVSPEASRSAENYPEPDDGPPLPDAKWDAVLGFYKRWSPAQAVWLRHDRESNDWVEVAP